MVGEKRLHEITDSVQEIGIDATADKLKIEREYIRRVLRLSKNKDQKKDCSTFSKNEKEEFEIFKSRFSPEERKLILSGSAFKQEQRTSIVNFDSDEVTIAFITDTHMGAKHFLERYWYSMLEECTKRGVKMILHAGDITEGMSSRPNQIYELVPNLIGASAQIEYARKLLSEINIPFKFIDGNHDRWAIASNGLFIGKEIARGMDNVEFIGNDYGHVKINNTDWMLSHGNDGGGCFDEETEIMTKTGWKFFKDLSTDDEVATMTMEGHVLEWQKPKRVTRYWHDGKMVHFKSRRVDCLVTPDHGMWTRVSDAVTYRRKKELVMPKKSRLQLNTKWHRLDAIDIVNDYSRQKYQFTQCVDGWVGENPEIINIPHVAENKYGNRMQHFGSLQLEDVAELMAWYVTEGHADHKSVQISQYQSVHPEYHGAICDLAERIGCGHYVSKKSVKFNSVELSSFLVSECGRMSAHVHLPQWLKNCTTDILELVLTTMINGDGWDSCPGAYGYKSISKKLGEDFAEIALKCGYSVTFVKDGETVYITKNQSTPTVNTIPDVIDYAGYVSCCEVENHLIYVRRNGKTLWTQNSYARSYRAQKKVEAFKPGMKPRVLLLGHDHKQNYGCYRNVHTVQGGALCTQSEFMRSTGKENCDGFHIIRAGIKDGEVKWFEPRWYQFY